MAETPKKRLLAPEIRLVEFHNESDFTPVVDVYWEESEGREEGGELVRRDPKDSSSKKRPLKNKNKISAAWLAAALVTAGVGGTATYLMSGDKMNNKTAEKFEKNKPFGYSEKFFEKQGKLGAFFTQKGKELGLKGDDLDKFSKRADKYRTIMEISPVIIKGSKNINEAHSDFFSQIAKIILSGAKTHNEEEKNSTESPLDASAPSAVREQYISERDVSDIRERLVFYDLLSSQIYQNSGDIEKVATKMGISPEQIPYFAGLFSSLSPEAMLLLASHPPLFKSQNGEILEAEEFSKIFQKEKTRIEKEIDGKYKKLMKDKKDLEKAQFEQQKTLELEKISEKARALAIRIYSKNFLQKYGSFEDQKQRLTLSDGVVAMFCFGGEPLLKAYFNTEEKLAGLRVMDNGNKAFGGVWSMVLANRQYDGQAKFFEAAVYLGFLSALGPDSGRILESLVEVGKNQNKPPREATRMSDALDVDGLLGDRTVSAGGDLPTSTTATVSSPSVDVPSSLEDSLVRDGNLPPE